MSGFQLPYRSPNNVKSRYQLLAKYKHPNKIEPTDTVNSRAQNEPNQGSKETSNILDIS